MFYEIRGFCPRDPGDLNRLLDRHAFYIDLHPEWKEAVAIFRELYGVGQAQVDAVVAENARRWLDSCGFHQIHDPDDVEPWLREDSTPGGPNASPLYGKWDIRVSWGEWGLEHLDVPGNACGLNLDRAFGAPPGGKSLLPHNIDTWGQKKLLLCVFLHFAEAIASSWYAQYSGMTRRWHPPEYEI